MMTRFSRIFVVCASVCGCAFGAFADGVAVSAGCDFTNAVMQVTAAEGATISIALNGTALSPQPIGTFSEGVYTYSLAVAAGKLYTYAVTVNSGTPYTGEILAANLKDGFASSSAGATNGSWDPALAFTEGVATVTGSTFSVTQALPASKIDVIESTLSFIDGFDEEDLAELDFTNAQAMLVVVTNTTSDTLEWRAWFGGTVPASLSDWTPLTGVTPAIETTYTVRTEFDYTTASAPKVSVLVKTGAGAYTRLQKSNGDFWFPLSDTAKTAVAAVAICGNVSFTSMNGKTSNANLFTDGTTEYASASAALQSGNPLTLLSNASVAPTARGKWAITAGGYTLVPYGSAALQSAYDGTYLRAYEAIEAKIGETPYVFLDEAFAAAADNATVTLLTNVTTTSATTLDKPVSLDLAGHDYLPSAALTLGTDPFIITNTVLNAGCVTFSTLTDDSSSLRIAGGLWSAADKTAYASRLMTNFTFYELANPVERASTTFAYQPKQSVEISVGGGTAKVEADFIAANVPGASEMTPEQLNAAMTADRTGTGNEMPLIQSYALSLDPQVATAKPIASSVQDKDSGTTMTLALGNVRVNTGCGLPVAFALKTGSSPDMTGATTGTAQADPSFTVSLDTTGANVKYYAIDIQFGN